MMRGMLVSQPASKSTHGKENPHQEVGRKSQQKIGTSELGLVERRCGSATTSAGPVTGCMSDTGRGNKAMAVKTPKSAPTRPPPGLTVLLNKTGQQP